MLPHEIILDAFAKMFQNLICDAKTFLQMEIFLFPDFRLKKFFLNRKINGNPENFFLMIKNSASQLIIKK